MKKTFQYENGTVTVHGIENWPAERFVPIFSDMIAATIEGKEEEKNAA